VGGANFTFVSGKNLKQRESYNSESEYAHSGYAIDEQVLNRAIRSILGAQKH
jgi:hypothetical protein